MRVPAGSAAESAVAVTDALPNEVPPWACGAEGRDLGKQPLFAVLSPHRPRFRADLGTLAAFARLPGGHRVRTLTPLLMSEAFASNSWMQPQCVRLQELRDGICRLRGRVAISACACDCG